MQNKGVVRLFAIVFALACLWELSFTFVSNRVQSQAMEATMGDQEKMAAYLDSMNTQEVFLSYTYKEVKQKEINLGLDLKGGMNVILEVSVKDIIKSLSGDSQDPVFLEALRNADKEQSNSQDSYLNIFFQELDKANEASGNPRAYSAPAFFGTKDMTESVGFNAEDQLIKQEITLDVKAAIANVYTVLRARIDQFGVVQPNIQPIEGTGRILVELPGVKEPERVRKLLQSTAELEFWKLHHGAEMLNFLNEANLKLRDVLDAPGSASSASNTTNGGNADLSSDLLGLEDVESTSATADSGVSSLDSLTEGSDSADVASSFNPLFAVIYPNVNQQGMPQGGPIVGFARIQDTSKVNQYLSMPQVRSLLPGNLRYTEFLWTAKPDDNETMYLLAIQGNREGIAPLDGGAVTDARQDYDEYGKPIVSMAMNPLGSSKWQKITREAASEEPKRSVAVVLDNHIYSYPTVQGEISGGRTQIYGQFSLEEAEDLANILRAGKLPAPARIIQADVVGPSLGKEAISASLTSFVIALIAVMIYMIFYYSRAGVIADFTLLLNMFFIFGILDAIGAVLTLPGMAGIVLTIGMAVDANVLIFERIREELRNGKGMSLAIKDGFRLSYSSIIDANVTTLLTGIILYAFGTGPIRGFATTLIIGILSSLFCAIFVSRLVFEWRLKGKKTIDFATKFSDGWFANVNVDFLNKRKMAYIISGVVIALSLGSLFTKGLNLGVDFVGGRSYQVRFDQPVNTAELTTALSAVFVDAEGNASTPQVKTLGSSNQVVVTTKYRIQDNGQDVEEDVIQKLYTGVSPFFAEELPIEKFKMDEEEGVGLKASRQVGPTIADDIKKSAVWSVLFSLIVIFIYILIRFKKWQFSLGAVAALSHDVIIVLGAFSIFNGILPFQLEIDQAFIAALLTVVGYSLNDTVVVFDRIREYHSHYHTKRSMLDIINGALNGTLSRTFNTSITTFFVLLIIFLFGGEVIRGFMFAILLGITVGTYSSLFIATPVMFDSQKKEDTDK